jgi:hypothetical protein
MKIQVAVFWFVTPRCDVIEYQHFGGYCCLHLQVVMAENGSGKPSGTLVS